MLLRLTLVCADTIQVHVRPLCLCGICSVQGLVRIICPEPDVCGISQMKEKNIWTISYTVWRIEMQNIKISYQLSTSYNNIITTHIQMKLLLSRQPYHIYSVGIDCSRLDSRQDHNDSLDNHCTLSQVEGNALMDTKVHCILVLAQGPLSLLQQYELIYKLL
jgi:hypothetical protein